MANLFRANKKGAPSINVQSSKIVTAGTSQQTFTPDTGYDAMEKVVVNPTPFQTKSVTATTRVQTVSPDSGKLLSQVTVNPQIHSQTMYYSSNGTKDLGENNNVRYVNINVPSGGLSETTLWTNPNPDVSFANQSITLSNDISSYDYIKCEYKVNNSTATYGSAIIPRNLLQQTSRSPNSFIWAIGGYRFTSSAYTRVCWINSNTEIYFTACRNYESGSVTNTGIIPTKISGLR